MGGDSNAIGLFFEFLEEPGVRMFGVEAGGRGIKPGEHAARFAGGRLGVLQGCMGGVDVQGAQRQLCACECGHGGQRGGQVCGCAVVRVGRQKGGCLGQPPQQHQPARRHQPGLQRVGGVAVGLQRVGRCQQRGGALAAIAAQVALGQGHLGLGHHAAGAGHGLVRAKRAGGAAQQLAGTRVFAQLGHGNAAQGQRRRVVAQGHALQRGEGVAPRQRAGGGSNHRIHGDRLHAPSRWRCGILSPSLLSLPLPPRTAH